MPVTLRLRDSVDIPVEAEVISPTRLAGKTADEIAALPVRQGNRTLPLASFFEVEGSAGPSASSTEVVVHGNLQRFKMLGAHMDGGVLVVEGSAGAHLGAGMIAGRIRVNGSVGPWAGAEMRGGNIQVEGDAGDHLCGAYPGSLEGMRGGRVYVAGDVGAEMASRMRRGLVVVRGNVGPDAACGMQGGTIVVFGQAGPRLGVGATRGMVVLVGGAVRVFPTFRFSGTAPREFIHYYLRYVWGRRPDFNSDIVAPDALWTKYIGDFSGPRPRAEIYVHWREDEQR